MPITSLHITDFRNLAVVKFSPSANGLNIICGKNGSGKTSILEAIHYLAHGRSFRSSTPASLIQYSADKFSLFAQLVSHGEPCIPIGIERHRDGLARFRIAEKEAATIAELATFLPIRIINAHAHDLIESGPLFRRKYLDWGLFYQSEGFLPRWRHFEHVLKQRNAVLRDKRPKQELDAWTDELIKSGLELDKLRRHYLQLLIPIFTNIAAELLEKFNPSIEYHPGWNEEAGYEATLAHHYPEEYRLGYTQFGPHRADLNITINTASAKYFLSRGQQKLLVCAMILAQGITLFQHANKKLIYLIDDLPAELDEQSKMKLIALLVKQQMQTFITTIEYESICTIFQQIPETSVHMKVFHVEQGNMTEQCL